MQKIRLFRILLPGALLLFLVLFVVELKPRNVVHTTPTVDADSVQRVEGVQMTELAGDRRTMVMNAGLVEREAEDRLHLEDISRLEVDREGRRPLVIRSEIGDIMGPPGERMMRFEEEVTVFDPEEDLTAQIPSLEVDEAAGEARSLAEVLLSGESLAGSAASLIYGLKDQPTEIDRLDLENTEGATLRAARARLHDGLDDVELIGSVELTRPGETLNSQRLRWRRNESKRLESAEATGEVSGTGIVDEGPPVAFWAERVNVGWGDEGTAREVVLSGEASVRQGDQAITAQLLEARRLDPPAVGWEIHAEGTVHVQGDFSLEPGLLRADTLDANVDEQHVMRTARATGRVAFDSTSTRAEAGVAEFTAGGTGEIRLVGTGQRKARLARERTRVAAEEIVTDARGTRLVAERRVESTLLPEDRAGGEDGTVGGLFLADDAIHFVADHLESFESGERLRFTGGVRGWQAERNLAADVVVVHQTERTLEARDNVTTRMPRKETDAGTSEADYVQIGANELRYSEQDGRGEFKGDVRVRLVEGWVESDRMEIVMSDEDGSIEEIQCFDSVRFEFQQPSPSGPPELTEGTTDRLVYSPAGEAVWLYGDKSPAAVRRIGENEGTTTGRVLRYRLDSGTLEVDSGEQGPARILTSGKTPG